MILLRDNKVHVYLIWRQQGFGEGGAPVDREAWTSDLDPPVGVKKTHVFVTKFISMSGCKCVHKPNSQRKRETEILLDSQGTSATARCMWLCDAMGCAGRLPPPDLQHLLERSVLICNSSKDSHATLSECIAS